MAAVESQVNNMGGQNKNLPTEEDVVQEVIENPDKNEDISDSSLKVMSKAMELPLMSCLTNTVSATSQYIYGTRPMTMMAEKIKDVGERDDIKSVISSMNTIYTQNLEKRVSDLKVTLNPTVQKMDDYACGGIDKVNEKISETNESYMAPMLNKMSESKEAYVDPIITKAVDIKAKTTQIVTTAGEKYATAKTTYIDPALKTAEGLKEAYVEPAVKVTKDYIAPVIVQAYKDPATAYGDIVNLGKEVATIAKDKTIEHAENAREYLKTKQENMTEQVPEDST